VNVLAADYGMGASESPDRNTVAYLAAERANPGKVVQLPAGVVNVGIRRGMGWTIKVQRRMRIVADPLGTTIRQVGDAAGIGTSLFEIVGGSGHEIGYGGGLTIDGSGLVNTGGATDQCHLVDIAANEAMGDVTFDRVIFQGSGQLNTGDGCRIVGTAAKPIRGVNFFDCTFLDCGRSGVSPNRGASRILIRRCAFHRSSDQHIDIESSTGAHTDYLMIERCLFGVNKTGGAAISLGGSGLSELVRWCTIRDCVFDGSGVIQGGYTEGLRIQRCVVKPAKEANPVSTISFLSYNRDVEISDTEIEHYAEQGDAPAILFYAQYGYGPDNVRILKSRITQYAAKNVIELRQVNRFQMRDCDVAYRGSANATQFGVWARTLAAPTTSFRMSDVRMSGQSGARLLAGVGLAPDTVQQFSGVDIERGRVDHATYGLHCNGTSAQYADEPMFRGVGLGAGVVDVGQSGADTPSVVLAGERGAKNVRALTRWGSPEGVVSGPAGSTCRSRQTGTDRYKVGGTETVPTATGWT
jgi:hypothetical protein